MASKLGQGKRVSSQRKELIYRAHKYFEDLERRHKATSATKRTLDCLGIGRSVLKEVLKEGESSPSGIFESPSKRYKVSRKRLIIDTFDREAIRRRVYNMYSQNQRITLSSLLSDLRENNLFFGGRTKLAELMAEMGFHYSKIDNRRYYYEQPHIVKQRHTYLRRIVKNRAEKKTVVYLDETWANAHDGKDLAWVETDTVTRGTLGGVSCPSGKGKRLIILGAGGDMGWVPNTTLIFQSKKHTGDYHDEMTGEHFEEWFREKLIPNLPPNSLIVMDNASYHSRIEEELPKKSWAHAKMVDWLVWHDVQFDTHLNKSEHFSIIQNTIKARGYTKRYIVDEMALKAGHEVVRLPVAHCTLNPIELAWAQVKGHIKANTRQFNLSEVERLAHEGFEVVTAERWGGMVRHVKEVEDHYWKMDKLDVLERFQIGEFTIRIDPNDSDTTLEPASASDDDVDSD